MYQGDTKKVLKFLGFLTEEYNLQFSFQSFPNYYNFYGPMDTYSFYNKYGCLTIHNAVQRGESAVYMSDKFYTDQYKLMQREISIAEYSTKWYWTFKGWLKGVAKIIKEQIEKEGNIFGLRIDKKEEN